MSGPAGCADQTPALPTVSPDLATQAVNLPAVAQAQQVLAQQLGVNVQSIRIQQEDMEWPDAGLGIEGQNTQCAQVVTPGFQVIFEVNGQQYEVRTDEAGDIVRVVPST